MPYWKVDRATSRKANGRRLEQIRYRNKFDDRWWLVKVSHHLKQDCVNTRGGFQEGGKAVQSFEDRISSRTSAIKLFSR